MTPTSPKDQEDLPGYNFEAQEARERARNPSNTWNELRDLAAKIEALVGSHKIHSLVHHESRTLVEHILLKARVHEMNAASLKTGEVK